ncbi:hypothetical protein VNO77_04134 [Canavalia gladiata]|uniref:Uncharacterized protein n=1 Tax=Canavalia gladiata TaxID=3824 RepID=A0AAN9MY22_CANGL
MAKHSAGDSVGFLFRLGSPLRSILGNLIFSSAYQDRGQLNFYQENILPLKFIHLAIGKSASRDQLVITAIKLGPLLVLMLTTSYLPIGV